MSAALLCQADDGLINVEEEARRLAIPAVGLSRADLTAPFMENGRCGGLAIQHMDVFEGNEVIGRQFEEDHDTGKFGARWAAFSRASVFPTFVLGLNGGGSDARAGAYVESSEVGVAARLAPEPMLIPLARIMLVKEGAC